MKVRIFLIAMLFSKVLLSKDSNDAIKRPKMVIGVVVDQMRWDYLYRYYDRYGNDGLKRLMQRGYSCEQTMINYLPSYTAPGHSCIYTGSVPAIHGIAGNDWVDKQTGRYWYCVDDTTVKTIGEASEGHSMSPANLLVTTVTDELRLATNFKSRVYGVALKDRSSILPAGHLANAAYWYNDKTGNFVSSTYYSNPNPKWLQDFNTRRGGDSLVKAGWNLLYDAATYTQSTADDNAYEAVFKGEKAPVFPHLFDKMSDKERYGILKGIPAGNTYTLMTAKACMEGEALGKGKATDFLTISLSATDYVGHRFSTNSMESEDTYLRLDRDIAEFIQYLDDAYGHDGYLLFLTADHGGAHNARFLMDNKVPAGVEPENARAEINSYIKKTFGIDTLVVFTENYQVCLNEAKLTPANRQPIRQAIMDWLKKQPQVGYVIDMENMAATPVPQPIHDMVVNGYHHTRSGSIQVVFNPGWYDYGGKYTGTTHGTWNPYDTHIPLLWYGWHIKSGSTNSPVNMTDIAPTIAAMLHIQMPSGCVGKPIKGVVE